MSRYLLCIMFTSALTTATTIAQPYPPPVGTPYSTPASGQGYPSIRSGTSPAAILEQRLAKLRAFLSGQAAQNLAEMQAFLLREIAPIFDFEQMSRWILGSAYRQLTPSQRQQFQTELMGMFFGALGRLAQPYAGQPPGVEIMPPRPRGQGEVVVSARVSHSQSYPVRVDFRFVQGPAGWKIYDVASNGSSAVVYYRNYFQSQQRRASAPVQIGR